MEEGVESRLDLFEWIPPIGCAREPAAAELSADLALSRGDAAARSAQRLESLTGAAPRAGTVRAADTISVRDKPLCPLCGRR